VASQKLILEEKHAIRVLFFHQENGFQDHSTIWVPEMPCETHETRMGIGIVRIADGKIAEGWGLARFGEG
jgi:hypothetical protein